MVTPDDLRSLTIVSAAERIRDGAISSLELTRAALERIAALNSGTHAFITVTDDRALALAEAADRALASGEDRGALHGIPISLKDLIDTAGVRTTAASRVFEDRVPAEDACVVERLRAAGAVLVGKTNLHELAFGVTNVNPHYGAARNPWDLERMSGGSSGGSAASVALSMALGSLGSDTGGSIRIPSALCGTVGLKPTYGRVSVRGVIPLSPSLDHVGPIARTVADAALLLEAVAGHDPGDPFSADAPVGRYSQQLEGGVAGMRLGVPRDAFFHRLEPGVASAVETALDALGGLGAERVEVGVPDTDGYEAIFKAIATAEVFERHEERLRSSPGMYGDDVRERIAAGKELRAVDYVRAQRERRALTAAVDAVLRSVDLLALPALPITAPAVDQTAIEWADGNETVLHALTRMTRLANLTGLPAISVPCGFSDAGLPIGLQMIGRRFDEARVLRAAHAHERDAGWSARRPPG